MPGNEEMERADLRQRILDAEAQLETVQAKLAELEALVLDAPILPMMSGEEAGEEWVPNESFRILRNPATDPLGIRVTGGHLVVIHIDVEDQAEQDDICADDSTVYIYATYTYATDTWAWTLDGASYPSESPLVRLFRIGRVTTASGRITNIAQDHVGDLEVYALESC
jgi:hypothetical protein